MEATPVSIHLNRLPANRPHPDRIRNCGRPIADPGTMDPSPMGSGCATSLFLIGGTRCSGIQQFLARQKDDRA